MSNIRELSAQMKAIAGVVSAHVGKAFGALASRIDDLEQRVKQTPAGGFSLDSLDLQLKDDGRTLAFTFSDGERTVAREITLPVVIDAGVYRTERSYAKGDGVTFGGSFWIAQQDAPGKPGEGEDWRLAVKKGRDGGKS